MSLNLTNHLRAKIHQQLAEEYRFLTAWTVNYDSAKRRAGICRLAEKQISISKNHALNNDESVVKDTILHEFAHAIAYEIYKETGHGKRWKEVARLIGATPKARGKFNLPDAPWILVHRCGKSNQLVPISERYRRNKKIKNYYLNRRPETKGELYFVAKAEFEQYRQGVLQQSSLVLVQ
jgi:predicted SprT family Zn-dependent metalloprotease